MSGYDFVDDDAQQPRCKRRINPVLHGKLRNPLGLSVLPRLIARPTATLCIDCKTLDELRERQVAK